MDFIVRHADYVITLGPDRTIITDGAIGVTGTEIVYVGKDDQLPEDQNGARVIDGRGKAVLPGFIDCHTHQMQQFTRGLCYGNDMFGCLFNTVYPLESALSPEDAYVSAMLAQVEMIKHGTTAFMDPGSAFPEETARAAIDSGIRGIVSRHAWDLSQTAFGSVPQQIGTSTEEALALCEEAIEGINGRADGRVRCGSSLRVLLGASDELCVGMQELALRHDVPLITHSSSTVSEVELSRARFGVSEIHRLDQLEMLSPRLGLIHVGWATRSELALLAERGVNVITDPGTALHFGTGIMHFGEFAEMLERGIPVCLSTDSAGWAAFDQLRQAWAFMGSQREAALDPIQIPPEAALEAVTRNGATTAMLGDQIGSLEVGKRADILVMDTRRPEWRPLHNPVATLVASVTGDSVETVLIDGKLVMENRRLLTVDEHELLSEAQARATDVVARAGLAKHGATSWPVI